MHISQILIQNAGRDPGWLDDNPEQTRRTRDRRVARHRPCDLRGFGAQGYEVIAIGRDREALLQTEALVREAGGGATSDVCDVCDPAAIERCVAGVLARFGAVDVLVNNAGGGSAGRPLTADELPDADWVDTVNLNMNSAFASAARCCRP